MSLVTTISRRRSVTERSPREQTNAMKNSTRHLFLPTTSVPLVPASALAPPTGDSSRAASPASRSQAGTPAVEDPSGLAPIALPPLPGLAAPATATPSLAGSPAPERPALVPPTPQTIDTRYESSKIPLDVAVVESILAAGAEERMKKVAANLLIVGGTGGIHNIGFAVESR